MLLICKVTNPEPALLYPAHTPPKAVLFCLNYSRARYQAAREFPYSSEPSTIITAGHFSPAHLSCLAFPSDAPRKALCLSSQHSCLPSSDYLVSFPRGSLWPSGPPASRSCECSHLHTPEPPLSPLLDAPDWPLRTGHKAVCFHKKNTIFPISQT